MPIDLEKRRRNQREYESRPEIQERKRQNARNRRLRPGMASAIMEYQKEWLKRPGNLEKNRAYKHAYYQRNKDKIILAAKEFVRLNPEKHATSVRNWGKNNPDKRLDAYYRRRAKMQDGPVEDCSKKISLLRRNKFCHWCCGPIEYGVNLHVDHVVPIKRDGCHVNDNLVSSCERCNTSRGDKLISEWSWELAA